MADITTTGNISQLAEILLSDDIQPGSAPSYQLCKLIYLFHPLGGKMVDSPIKMAQSKPRKINVPGSPDELVTEAFINEWKALNVDALIAATMAQARIYGIGAVYMGITGFDLAADVDPWTLPSQPIFFNVYDPLNTAGSLVLNQTPTAEDFQKPYQLTAGGEPVAMSRACIVMNERPVYLAFTSSAFGFVGRSVYQRAVYPLKSFLQSMITDNMVTIKAGVIVAKMKPTGSIVDRMMAAATALKRNLVKESRADNVISIQPEEAIETIDLTNVNQAMDSSRSNILQNVATAGDMPAVILRNETFTKGFGEGTEDAKMVAAFIEDLRRQLAPLYDFFDRIVQYRAWNEEFYASLCEKFPGQYQPGQHKIAFMQWRNAFSAEWPSFLEEPDSEKIKTEDTKYKAIMSALEILLPNCDPNNKARLIQWAADNLNENRLLFGTPLELDYQAMADYTPPQPEPMGFPGANDPNKQPAAPAPENVGREG